MDEAKKTAQDFAEIIDNIPCMAFTCLPDGSAEFNNRLWREYTGLSVEQFIGHGWAVAIHPDDLPRHTEIWSSVRDSGEPGEIESRVRRFDGEYRWFLFRAVPV